MTDETTALAALLRSDDWYDTALDALCDSDNGNNPFYRDDADTVALAREIADVMGEWIAANVRVAPSPTEVRCPTCGSVDPSRVARGWNTGVEPWVRCDNEWHQHRAPSPTEIVRCMCGEIESNRMHHEPKRSGWHPFVREVAPSPTEPPCGDDSWDTRYECVKPSGHPVEGPGLTSHEYRFKRATSRVAPSPETPGHRAQSDNCAQGDHDDCAAMVECEAEGHGLHDCGCACHTLTERPDGTFAYPPGHFTAMASPETPGLTPDGVLYRVWDRVAALRLTGEWKDRKRQVLDIIAEERANVAVAIAREYAATPEERNDG